MMRLVSLVPFVLAASLPVLAGCNGSSSHRRSVVTGVTGTAASGAPIANQPVVIKDRTGTTIQSQTDANGRFAFATATLTPPYLLQVANGANGPLFSVATTTGNANITPLTHLMLMHFYGIQGTTPLNAFATPALFELPTAEATILLSDFLERTLQKALQDEQLEPDTFDFILTPFQAGGAGYDAVLEQSAVDLGSGQLTWANGVTTQTTTFTTNPNGRVDATTVGTGPAGNVASVDSTLVPIGIADPVASALVAADRELDNFQEMVNTKGNTLLDSDVVPHLTTDAMQDGEDVGLWATDLATYFRELSIDDVRITRIHGYDPVNLVLDAEYRMRLRSAPNVATRSARTQFKQTSLGSTALIFGNQRPANVDGRIYARVDSSPTGDVQSLGLLARALAVTTTVTKVTVTDDAGVFTGADVPKTLSPLPRVLQPSADSATWFDSDLDEFVLDSGPLAPPPPPPVVFSFTVEPAAGAPITVTDTATGATDEFLVVNGPTGHLLSDAQLGTKLLITWTPPASFATDEVDLRGFVADLAGNTTWFAADSRLIPNESTSADLTFPTTLPGGGTVEVAGFELTIAGPNGENSTVLYTFSG